MIDNLVAEVIEDINNDIFEIDIYLDTFRSLYRKYRRQGTGMKALETIEILLKKKEEIYCLQKRLQNIGLKRERFAN